MGQTTDDTRWETIASRDRSADGSFVYAVKSTGIYCKPSCASKRPARKNVEFFDLVSQAEDAGFRACLRCKPREIDSSDPHVEIVRRACKLLEQDLEVVPNLEELAQRLGISPWHLQRTFKKIMGISPRAYAESWRMSEFRKQMNKGADVTTAMYAAGFGSSSRLYEKSSAQLGMTPGEYGRGGEAATINYTIVDSPMGKLLIAGTKEGLCSVTLGDDEETLEKNLRSEFNQAEITRNQQFPGPATESIISYLSGRLPRLELPLDVRATAFQRLVWEELQKIPYGSVRSYSQIATALGKPTAARAVARACATNPVALVIPCHRVVREGGALGGYRWGIERKASLLEMEKKNIKS